MTATPEQLDQLVDHLMGFADGQLAKSGEFLPFGAIVDPQGEIVSAAVYGGNDHPNASDVFDELLAALSAQALSGEAIAFGIATDVNTPPELPSQYPDAVRLTLHTQGDSRNAYYPYRRAKTGLFKKTVLEFADPLIVDLAPIAFAGSGERNV